MIMYQEKNTAQTSPFHQLCHTM